MCISTLKLSQTNKWRHFSEKRNAFFPAVLHSEPREDTLSQEEFCGFAQIILIMMQPNTARLLGDIYSQL